MASAPLSPFTSAQLSLRRGLLLAAVLLAAWLPGWTPAGADDAGVDWRQGRLSVKAGKQPLGTVLKHIQQRTGIVVKSNQPLPEPVLRGVEQMPLVEGLHQLLASHNHMIIDGQGRRPLRVFVLGPGNAPPGLPLPSLAQPAGLASPDSAARIEAVERLADLNDESSLAALRQASSDPDEAVRAVAQQALASRESQRASRVPKTFR
jgi:HEAT repeats